MDASAQSQGTTNTFQLEEAISFGLSPSGRAPSSALCTYSAVPKGVILSPFNVQTNSHLFNPGHPPQHWKSNTTTRQERRYGTTDAADQRSNTSRALRQLAY